MPDYAAGLLAPVLDVRLLYCIVFAGSRDVEDCVVVGMTWSGSLQERRHYVSHVSV